MTVTARMAVIVAALLAPAALLPACPRTPVVPRPPATPEHGDPSGSPRPAGYGGRGSSRTAPDYFVSGGSYKVVWVYDGDSLAVEDDQGRRVEVRCIGIDSPEMEQAFHDEAAALHRSLVEAGTVRIEQDPGDSRGHDGYGRILGYVYAPALPSDDDGVGPNDEVFVNAEILRAGLGYFYPWAGTSFHDDQLKAAQDQARRARAGLWSAPPAPEPHYLGSSRRFHRPSCDYAGRLKNPVRYPTRDAAFDAGLAPCRECGP